jgi:hypothetical protein
MDKHEIKNREVAPRAAPFLTPTPHLQGSLILIKMPPKIYCI